MTAPLRFAVLSLLVTVSLLALARLTPTAPVPAAAHAPLLPTCLPPPVGLVAWWPFDIIVAGEQRDLAAIRNNGVPMPDAISGPTLVDHGLLGHALQFDGTNSLEVIDHPELNFGHGGFTIDAWIRITDTGRTGYMPIVDKQMAGPADAPIGYSLFVADGRLTFGLRTDATSPVEVNAAANDSISDDLWHFVAVAGEWHNHRDGTLDVTGRLYVDGDESLFQSSSGLGTADVGAPLLIGSNNRVSPVPSQFFTGEIDEVELFKRALSAIELGAIRTNPVGKCKPNLISECGSGTGMQCFGVNELINVDVINNCGMDAVGFRFTLYGFAHPVTSTTYTFSKTFEEPCPTSDNRCNPFSPPNGLKGNATYFDSTGQITLDWHMGQNASAAVQGQPYHFGYTVNYQQSAGYVSHTFAAAWLLPSTTVPCPATIVHSTTWSVPAGGIVMRAPSQQTQTVKVTVANHSQRAMAAQSWLVASRTTYALEQLLATNPDMITVMRGPPMARQVLAPEEQLSLEVPIEIEHESALLITEWRDPDMPDGPVLARVFNELPLAAFRQPPPAPATKIVLPITFRQES